jgi:hypothetical protein
MKARLISHVSLLAVFVLIFDRESFPQGLEYVKGHYTKHEYAIAHARWHSAVYGGLHPQRSLHNLPHSSQEDAL